MENQDIKNKKGKLPVHPHDSLFKAVFKNPNRAIEFLQAKLPKPILARLKIQTLRLDDSSFVDEKLSEFIADICFLCENMNGDLVRLCLIIEHKSYLPSFPPLQVMNYQMNAWNQQVETKPAQPVVVLPVIFYHGKEKWNVRPWPHFLKGFSEEFAAFTPQGGYIFIDLSDMADEEIKRFRSGFLITSLLLMKHRFERKYLLDNLTEIVNFVESDEEVDESVRIRYLQNILHYLQCLEAIKWKEAKQKLNSLRMANQAIDILDQIRIDLKEILRWEMGDQLREEARKEVEEETRKLRQKARKEIQQEVQQEIRKEIQQEVQQEIRKEIQQEVQREIRKEIQQEVQREIRKEKNYLSAYNMVRKGFELKTISDLIDVPMAFLNNLVKYLKSEEKAVSMLKNGKEVEEVSKALSIPVPLVKAIKKNRIDKKKK